MHPTPERIRELLDYDKTTATFTWRQGRRAGQPAGNGQIVQIDGGRYLLTTCANLHAFGEPPPGAGTPLSHKRLQQVLHYTPETGTFCWTGVYRLIPDGVRADRPSSQGYHYLSLDGGNYLAHRLAWFYMTGEWPTRIVRHRDETRANNAWRNLVLEGGG